MDTVMASRSKSPGLSRAVRLFKWVVTLTCVAVLVRLVDLGAVVKVLLSARLGFLSLTVAVAFADRFLMVAKWLPLLRQQAPEATFGQATRAYFAAGLAHIVVPTPVGGDTLRAVALGRGGKGIPEIGASIVMERLLGIVASGFIYLLSLWVAVRTFPKFRSLTPWVLALLVFALLCCLLPFNRRFSRSVRRWLESRGEGRYLRLARRFGAAYSGYRARRRMLLVVALLSLVEQFFPILGVYTSSLALGVRMDLTMLIVAVPLSVLASRVPIALGGIGVSEGAFVVLLGRFGVPSSEALALALVGTAMNFVVAIPGLFFWSDLVGIEDSRKGAAAAAGAGKNGG
jgi:glycosyltransferase 2 family protein